MNIAAHPVTKPAKRTKHWIQGNQQMSGAERAKFLPSALGNHAFLREKVLGRRLSRHLRMPLTVAKRSTRQCSATLPTSVSMRRLRRDLRISSKGFHAGCILLQLRKQSLTQCKCVKASKSIT
mmetsp:Transcript_74878/g.150579  ORF Transcript_74878/g.150579 Transcript_74878/m.150579 type:complete len:123 (+) Transcript_74878:363-731(+)